MGKNHGGDDQPLTPMSTIRTLNRLFPVRYRQHSDSTLNVWHTRVSWLRQTDMDQEEVTRIARMIQEHRSRDYSHHEEWIVFIFFKLATERFPKSMAAQYKFFVQWARKNAFPKRGQLLDGSRSCLMRVLCQLFYASFYCRVMWKFTILSTLVTRFADYLPPSITVCATSISI